MAKTKLYILYVSLWDPGLVKMASLVVTWMPSLKHQRSGHTFTKEGLLQLPG